jgi:hypothetical protein
VVTSGGTAQTSRRLGIDCGFGRDDNVPMLFAYGLLILSEMANPSDRLLFELVDDTLNHSGFPVLGIGPFFPFWRLGIELPVDSDDDSLMRCGDNRRGHRGIFVYKRTAQKNRSNERQLPLPVAKSWLGLSI